MDGKMTEQFREMLKRKALSEQAIDALAAQGLDTIEALRECNNADLLDAGLTTLGDRKKVLALANEGQPATIETDEPSGTTAGQSQGFDAANFLKQLSGSSLNLGSIKPRINVDFVNRAADSVLAYVIVSTGVLEVFGNGFWSSVMLEDISLRKRIHEWQERSRTQQYLSIAAKNELLDAVPKLFAPSFDTLILNARSMSAQLEASGLLGAQARINISSDAASLVALRDLIPLAAEGLSNAMIASEMPEQALSVVAMINDLVSLIKEPLLLANAGITSYDGPDEGAINFLTRRFGQEIANKFRLALAYEQCVRAIAACPATEEIGRGYLQVVGLLASRLCTYLNLVVPGTTVEHPFSQLQNLTRKSAETIGQSQTNAKIKGASPTGWPFPKFGSKVKGRVSATLPMIVGPEVGDLISCTVPLLIVGTGKLTSCEIKNLIWFGNGEGEGELTSCNVTNFYCQVGDEPEITGGDVPMAQYKTRDELIALAVELAQQRKIEIL